MSCKTHPMVTGGVLVRETGRGVGRQLHCGQRPTATHANTTIILVVKRADYFTDTGTTYLHRDVKRSK
jgi:hypothetical protein